MRVLYLADRLSTRGGADHHLRQVMSWATAQGWHVRLGCGAVERDVEPPTGVDLVRLRGLAAPVASEARLGGLDELLGAADVVHLQNVMNPVVIARAVATGRALVTVQDHRAFCPGPGRTLPDGSRCRQPMADGTCRLCLPDDDYRRRMLAVTRQRLDALRGARTIVLSRYMAAELTAAGHPGAEVIPPWFETAPPRTDAGGFVLVAGRLVAHKGVLDAWSAWTDAGRPLPLRVAGAGPLAAELVGAELLGWLPAEAFARQLRLARALLFPARWQEPFGIAGVEALAAGTPVVAADSGGTRDWSDAGCVRVAPGDVAAMACALRRLVEQPHSALALGECGRRAVRRRFDQAELGPRLAVLYRAAAARA